MSVVTAFRLVDLLKQVDARTGLSKTYTEQDNSYVKQWALKDPNANRTYCYVLFEDKRKHNPPANLVFRFRNDARPREWFKTPGVPLMAKDWAQRFGLMWEESAGVPPGCADEGRATKQFGVLVRKEETEDPEIHEVLERFLRIAAESVTQARLRQASRNWTRFDSMIA